MDSVVRGWGFRDSGWLRLWWYKECEYDMDLGLWWYGDGVGGISGEKGCLRAREFWDEDMA